MRPSKVLLQTTIPFVSDDWNISRFSLLHDHLEREGFEVTSRDKEAGKREDPLLLSVDESEFDEMWLLAVDSGGGLSAAECEAITRFRKRGRGLLIARDHQD